VQSANLANLTTRVLMGIYMSGRGEAHTRTASDKRVRVACSRSVIHTA